MKEKVFGVGFIKTGTTTLGHALKRLGYNPCYGGYTVANRLVQAYVQFDMKKFDEVIRKYDCFDDFPFCAPGMAQQLDKAYPDSKFILTTREPESWYKSISSYFGGKTDMLGMSRNQSIHPLGRFPGLVVCMLATFGELDVKNKDHFIETYKAYNKQVIDYFKNKPGKLLVVSWMEGGGWKELCPFLGKPIPSFDFPKVNSQKLKG